MAHQFADAFWQATNNVLHASIVQKARLAKTVKVVGKQQPGLCQFFHEGSGETGDYACDQILLDHRRSRISAPQQSSQTGRNLSRAAYASNTELLGQPYNNV